MPEELTPAQKAARTRKLRAAERETQQKHLNAFEKARASEAASKEALRAYCEKHNWRVAFFEGKTGSPRTGIIDAIIFRIAKGNADVLDLRLVQLKGGKAGITGAEIARLRKAPKNVMTDWMIAAFDGEFLQIIPEDLNADRVIGPASPEAIAKRSEAAKRAWITIRANREKAGAKGLMGPRQRADLPKRRAASRSDDHARLRAELNKLKPSFISQADWDATNDELDRQDEVTLAAMIEVARQYEIDNPDEPIEPAPADAGKIPSMEEFLAGQGLELKPDGKISKKAAAKRTKTKSR